LTETGEIEATIAGTYLYKPSSYGETSMELLWINTSEDLRVVIEATGSGSFYFNVGRYFDEADLSIAAIYEDIQITTNSIAT
jgi:hypothetical protein